MNLQWNITSYKYDKSVQRLFPQVRQWCAGMCTNVYHTGDVGVLMNQNNKWKQNLFLITVKQATRVCFCSHSCYIWTYLALSLETCSPSRNKQHTCIGCNTFDVENHFLYVDRIRSSWNRSYPRLLQSSTK